MLRLKKRKEYRNATVHDSTERVYEKERIGFNLIPIVCDLNILVLETCGKGVKNERAEIIIKSSFELPSCLDFKRKLQKENATVRDRALN